MKTLFMLLATFSLFGSSIPTLDMRDFYDEAKRDAFIIELEKACHEVGFFAVVNTGVDSVVIDRAYEAIEEFFALDTETKFKYFDPNLNGQRGYIPSETAKGQTKLDIKEFLHIGTHSNLWPKEVDIEEPVMAMYREIERYSVPLQEAMSLAMGLPKDALGKMVKGGESLLRPIHYPNKEGMWAAAHTDIDLYTILPRSTAEGLEVQRPDGTWIKVQVPDDAFVINVGDMLQNLTNGYFRSSVHQVRATKADYERYSMVLFMHCYNECPCGPLPHMIEKTGGVRKFAYATEWELLMERLADLRLASPAMLKELAESDLFDRLREVGRESPDALEFLREHGYSI